MSFRRSPIRREATSGSFQEGHVQPHVEASAELQKALENLPPTVTVEELEAEGYTHDLVYTDSTGRPTSMTYILVEELCRRLANGELLKRICSDDHMPNPATVRKWAVSNDWFREKYARAMEIRVEKMAEEILEISDDGFNDYSEYEDYKGRIKIGPDTDHIRRSELRVESRKWIMSKLLPKKWGNKLEHTGPGGGAIQHEHAVQVLLPHNGRDIIDVTPAGQE